MIFVMSDKYKNLFVKGLLALLAFSFALAGIIGFSGTMNQANIVKINKTNINVNAFVTFLNNTRSQLYNSDLNTAQIDYLNSNTFKVNTLKTFILENLVNLEIEKLNLNETNEAVMNDIYNEPSFKDENGNFSLALFKSKLAMSGLTEAEYVKYLSSYNSKNALFNMLSVGNINNSYINELFSKNLNKYLVVDIFTIVPNKIKFKETKPTEEEIKEYYEKNKVEFFIPEQKVISYIEVDLSNYNSDMAKNKLSQLEDLVLSANNIDEIAKEFNTKKETIIYTQTTTNLPEDLSSEVLEYTAGTFSDLIYKDDSKYKVYYVEEVINSKFLTLKESKDKIINSILEQEKEKNALKVLNQYIDEMQQSKDIKKVANNNGLTLHADQMIYRHNLYYPMDFVSDLFNLKEINTFTEPIYDSTNKVYTIGYLKEIKNISENDTGKFIPFSAISNSITTSYDGSMLYLFENYLLNSNKVVINEELLNSLN